jgi:hypothetical protein
LHRNRTSFFSISHSSRRHTDKNCLDPSQFPCSTAISWCGVVALTESSAVVSIACQASSGKFSRILPRSSLLRRTRIVIHRTGRVVYDASRLTLVEGIRLLRCVFDCLVEMCWSEYEREELKSELKTVIRANYPSAKSRTAARDLHI